MNLTDKDAYPVVSAAARSGCLQMWTELPMTAGEEATRPDEWRNELEG